MEYDFYKKYNTYESGWQFYHPITQASQASSFEIDYLHQPTTTDRG